MITPNDIATKDFKKVAMGYSPEEVDIFLDDIYEDYERLYIDSQKEKPVPAPVPEVTPDKFGALENMIERTLLLAETAAAETKTAARTEAEHIVNGAKVEAEAILQEARMKAYAIEEEINSLQSRYELMKARVKLMLYTEIELLDQNEIVAEKEEAHQNNQ
ncbi:DivIVA domain-containing protein [Chakrabartyella piscis]|uniref:DivIVA domain-containing protein n=1 Tax=Chakrabartyella piscis TaxID=2918914 RepID=UPI002958C120|nr:DivIVA domain-containing protein [Chakrabartyella piscis]